MASAAVVELAPPLKRGASATAAASPVRAVPVTKLMSLALSQSCRSPTGVMANCLAMGTGAAARIDVTIVMPCLNEAKWLPAYIANAREALTRIRAELGLTGEVLIADNGSADGSQLIARALGATLVEVSQPGYGAALTSGMQSASGTFLVMGDADGSYDFRECVEMIRALLSGSLHGVALQRRDQNQRDALEEPICRQSSAYRSLEPSIRRRRK
jgi:hypothetical protein